MTEFLICAAIFVTTYLLNITFISVFYHRGLTHQAVSLHPAIRKFVVLTGNWVTGLDPKGWACMHRLHHQYSDTDLDPHSPAVFGVAGTMYAQLKSYQKVLKNLIKQTPSYTQLVRDLDFEVNWLNKYKMWWMPYALHAVLGLGLGVLFGSVWIGMAYFLGMMTHPIQGWMVNAFGHSSGYRNFDIDDQSTNNTFVALAVFGEGYQNNHHRFPQSARFSVRWFEVDTGYWMTAALEKMGCLKIRREYLAPHGVDAPVIQVAR